MLLTQLATVAYRTGRPVKESQGWQTRGRPGGMAGVRTLVVHHTVDNPPGDYPSLAVVRDGRPGLPGPLSHYGIGRSGTIYVIAAGRCNHAGAVRDPDYANEFAIGIEAANNGTGEPWGEPLMESYVLLARALMTEFSLPVTRVLGHKEVCDPPGRKTDPSFDMGEFRDKILGAKPAPTPPPPAPKGTPDMHTCSYAGTAWLIDGSRRKVPDPAFMTYLKAAGIRHVGEVSKDYLGWWPYSTTGDDQTAAILAAVKAGGTPEQIADAVIAELVS